MNKVLLLAGGIGSRMGMDVPKQFVEVAGKPIIIHTLEMLDAVPEIDRVQAVCIDSWCDRLSEYITKYGINKVSGIVSGGGSRYDSTRRGMVSLDAADDDVIIVHDSVRPLVPRDCWQSVISVCQAYGNSMAVLECNDTMYAKTTAEATAEVLDRSQMVRGQTPEAVTGSRMREMYAKADAVGVQNDSISALQNALGWAIHFAKGSEQNIKLTRPEDIRMFQAMLSIK